MHALFPFNLPAPTLWYVLLYVVTLLLHVVFMSYVLAGSILLGVAGLRGKLGRAAGVSPWAPVTTILKDWMPFALSAAITAGVAPLLFVQILYQQEFYTANLLSFHRWMAILPVLIVAFYLLYLLNAHRIEGKAALQGLVAILVMSAVLFVAWSWIENHLLSLDRAVWPAQYQSQSMVYASPAILPRLAFWIAGAFPIAATLLAWQLHVRASQVEPDAASRAARPLAVLAITSAGLAVLGAWVVLGGPAGESDQTSARSVATWNVVATVGAVLGIAAWSTMAARAQVSSALTFTAFAGGALFWLAALMSREAARWSTAGSPVLIARHESVGTLAGFSIFVVFAVAGLGAIAWVITSVRRTLVTSSNRQ